MEKSRDPLWAYDDSFIDPFHPSHDDPFFEPVTDSATLDWSDWLVLAVATVITVGIMVLAITA